ncbi:MFS transporter [Paenibacillus sp. P96]|uniref:MFS transporter n=1 Tax=Paenibacillus zeirhizosphaerae TaxID=2987519 RepID=A0ABT9FMB3_9BACL|nr:MFS transporter [Paenibacillus sp. P96]MDP4095882.1 MFS transporter [Paenibacillus sp. P96]
MQTASETNENTTVTSSKTSLFTKDFTFLVICQIITLFGNAMLRFALPLYILEQSGNAALFGLVSASAFLPMIILSPIGGMIADRVNKQRMMVTLDFLSAALVLGFMLVNGQVSLIPLVIVVLVLLYGIHGAYTPAVQASLPLLAKQEQMVSASAVINLVNSLSSLLGPIIGGMLYSAYGLTPILAGGGVSFLIAAVLGLFIRIAHKKQQASGSMLAIAKDDMKRSMRYIMKENPIMAKVIGIVFLFNLFMSAMLIIGLPVLITQTLGLSILHYGVAEAALAAGGLTGGILAGVLGKKLTLRHAYLLLLLCAAGSIPMGLVILLGLPAFTCYIVITAMSFLLMIAATIFTVQMFAFVQVQTPPELLGKVISCLMGLTLSAQPIGQAIYGLLFERFAEFSWAIWLGGATVACLIAVFSKRAFSGIREETAASAIQK